MPRSPRDHDRVPEPLLGVRAALILTLALAAGAIVATLTWWAAAPLPAVALAGLTATGGAVSALNNLIGEGPDRSHRHARQRRRGRG